MIAKRFSLIVALVPFASTCTAETAAPVAQVQTAIETREAELVRFLIDGEMQSDGR